MFSIGSANFVSLLTNKFRSISKFWTELLKNVLSISAQAVLSVTMSSPSKRVMLLLNGVLSEKKGFTCFQNFLLSVRD